ncbi:LuxR C-terminal-related transcriptional regulator [Microbacterium plantarum]|uniref:LuxR C-terminal-related transcriptional regulator n=1 Tax=Microbacterium plantarum TaxID=1816425 RepID=UPI002B4979DD|nr:LuxR C-terminal-related transcriptional regulator [Microbacterium plantarum]WRK18337.1 LuxR C-terminal-related transcriptional regulator [Microbacterium plantarum]
MARWENPEQSRRAHDQGYDVVGDETLPDAVADALIDGRSVVMGGPLGSGKSFLRSRVVDALRHRGEDPIVVRASAVLRRTYANVLEAVSDPRALALLGGGSPTTPPIVVVDDAQELDAVSLAALFRAVHSGRATVLMAVTEPRLPTSSTDEVVDVIHDLWLSGSADRIELPRLSPRDADRLLSVFAPDDPFDSVTRATILWSADGSRLLLRALVDASLAALAEGRDPLVAIADGASHGSLAAVLHAHVRDLDDDQLRALILIDRAPGISRADATRLVPAAVVNELRACGLVYDDGSACHRLSANRVLARAAERVCGRERSEAVISDALDRLHRDDGRWWSTPLARLLADRWVRTVARPSDLDDVSLGFVERVILSAAQDANDTGDAADAGAYTAWITSDVDAPAIRREHHLAAAGLGGGHAVLPVLDLAENERRRAQTLVTARPTDGARAADVRHIVADDALVRSREAVADLRLRDAVVLTEHVRRDPTTSLFRDRVDVELLAGMARAYLGETAAMREALDRATRLFTSGASFEDTLDRLAARSYDLACHTVAGTDDRETVERLAFERDMAVRAGGPALAAASLAAVLVEVRNGRALAARRELRAAAERAPHLGSESLAMIELETAYALALFDHPREARQLLGSVDVTSAASRMLRHSFAATSSVVAAAEGRISEAHAQAADAWALSSVTDAVMLQIRDVHRLAVLGHPHVEQTLEVVRGIIGRVEAPCGHALMRDAESAAADGERAVELSAGVLRRLRAALSLREGRDVTPEASQPASSALLTAREREIAHLVADGLSNRRIAEVLFVSVRTVESHMYQARAKVGASTRRELGAAVAGEARPEKRPTSPPSQMNARR